MTDALGAARRIEDLLAGEMQSRSLICAHRLGVFEALADGAKTFDELAKDLHVVNEPTFLKLLQALHGLGLVCLEGGLYRNSDVARLGMVESSAGYYGALVDFFSQQFDRKPPEQIVATIREGAAITASVSPAQWRIYMQAMRCIARLSADRIADSLDFGDAAHVLDLGGGTGDYAVAFCSRHPGLSVTIYDVEPALATARVTIERAGLSGRIRLEPGSFTDSEFGGVYDAVFVSHTIHLFDEAAVLGAFRAARRSLTRDGVLIVRDTIMNESKTEPLLGALIALHMWVAGQAYSFDQIRDMMGRAGFARVEPLQFASERGPDVIGSLVVGR